MNQECKNSRFYLPSSRECSHLESQISFQLAHHSDELTNTTPGALREEMNRAAVNVSNRIETDTNLLVLLIDSLEHSGTNQHYLLTKQRPCLFYMHLCLFSEFKF